ncbi:YgiT-type zinc finger domain [Dorea longicatena]|nr:YgiT-type zinc finger domain [Dorea longicatena]
MVCMNCGANAEKGFTTDVTDVGDCLIIVRNVPCYKCEKAQQTLTLLVGVQVPFP